MFNAREFGMEQESAFFTQDMVRKRESRILRLNLSYRFGKI